MKIFKVRIWYRYAVANESEKDFYIRTTFAENEDEAIETAKKLYQVKGHIPFKFEILE